MTTIREKRRAGLKETYYRTVEKRDACIDSLIKLELKLKDMRKQMARLDRAIAAEPKVVVEKIAPPVLPAVADDLGIPAFLQRKPDAVRAAEILAEQAELKKAKSRGRIEKMKAKQRGDLKKMPLTGRAALEAIRA